LLHRLERLERKRSVTVMLRRSNRGCRSMRIGELDETLSRGCTRLQTKIHPATPWPKAQCSSTRRLSTSALEAGARPPVSVQRGAREPLVMVMPIVTAHVVDGAPRQLADLVRLWPRPAARDGAEVDDRHRAVRVHVHVRLAKEHADESVDARLHTGFLVELPHDGLLR